MLQILHNPRCGKSRNCLAFLKDSENEFEIINYLVNPLSANEIKELIVKLNIKPIELIRKKESIWVSNFKGKSLNENEIVDAMVKYPILIERPVLINGEKAIIGRDIEKVRIFI